VEVTGAGRQDHDRTRRVGLQLLFLELLAQPDVENTGYDGIDPVLGERLIRYRYLAIS
jgi:hypothetical protein